MDIIELGGNIQLEGFNEVDGGRMIVIKKIVGNYARKFSEKVTDFKSLSLTLIPNGESYDLNALVKEDGNQVEEKVTEKNLFVAIDSVLKKIESSFN